MSEVVRKNGRLGVELHKIWSGGAGTGMRYRAQYVLYVKPWGVHYTYFSRKEAEKDYKEIVKKLRKCARR